LCCAVREDLARTLRGLIEQRLCGAIRPFRRLVIETTGLADPAPILYTLGADPMLDHCLRLGGVVVVVDAQNGAATIDRFAEAARQVAVADTLAISKTDLAPFGPDLAVRLDRLNGRARRVIARDSDNPGDLLFGAGDRALPPRVAATAAAAHSHGIDAFAVSLGGAFSRLDFAMALGGLARARGYDLLRVKGIVEFRDRPQRPALVQAAQHAMFAPEWLDGWPAGWPEGEHRSRLVFVVHDIPRAEILAHFAFAEPTLCADVASPAPAEAAAACGATPPAAQ
jgi:G3E family GTPase